jgi:S1-C subfamily serine protease
MTHPTDRPNRGYSALLAIGLPLILGLLLAFGNLFVSGRVGATTATATGALTTVVTTPTTAAQTTALTTTSAAVPNIASAAATARAATVLVLNLDRTGATQGSGSGFIIDPSGIIVTNNHVVAGAQAVKVQLPDNEGATYTATVVGTDAQTDLAVLRIDAQGLPTVALGDSSALVVGDWVVAVGNALALDGGPTVTAGVVSATGRDVEQAGTAARPGQSATSAIALYDPIQTDAAINEGDSGGPLVDLTGAVVGINTLGTSDAQGIGFAIAIDEARPIIEQLLANAKVTRAALGISGQTVTAAIAAAQNLDRSSGVLVAQVTSGSPAATAGLYAGDIITQIGDMPIANQGGLQEALLTTYAPGQTVAIQIARGGTTQTVTVTLG